MARQTPLVIDIPTHTKTGLRGKLERLFHEYNTKAQALRITAEILDEDDRQMAVSTAPKKYLAAINHRNGDTGRPIVTKAKAKKPKAPKAPIHGHALTLFLLEHLSKTPRPPIFFRDALAALGSKMNGDLRVLNGPLGGVCVRKGWAKRSADGYRITAKGAPHKITLRNELETAGRVRPGGYTALDQ